MAYVSGSDEVKEKNQSGEMYKKCRRKQLSRRILNGEEQEKIYQITMEKIAQIKQFQNA